MFRNTQNAVAAISRLAEVYPQGLRLSSREVADARDMPQTLAAKLLTQLSQVGLVSGAPGPGGGYALAKPPQQVCLYDVAAVFERVDEKAACPFGRNWCGTGEKCPLHDQIAALLKLFAPVIQKCLITIQGTDSGGLADGAGV